MTRKPLVFTTTHRIKFSDLDPYDHMRTAMYPAYFVDHRMEGLRERLGWDLKAIAAFPFMAWVRRLEIDFVRQALGDQSVTITSFVREFRGADAHIECRMADDAGHDIARCLMIVAHVERSTRRPADWPDDVMEQFYEPSEGTPTN